MAEVNEATAEEIIIAAARGLPAEKRQEINNVIDGGPNPNLITEKQAADMLGMSKAHLCKWRNGQIPEPFPFKVFPVPGSNQYRYDQNQVKDFVAARWQAPEPDTKEKGQ